MYTILQGDCCHLLPTLSEHTMTFADPPFNIGEDYDIYSDKRSDYVDWCLDWISKCWEKTSGVLCLHGPDHLADIYTWAARHLGMPRIAWIIWHYRFGQCRRTNWIDSKCHCLVFARDNYTWNPEAVLVPSDRQSVYNDPRIHDTENGGSRLPGDVWGVPSDGPYWGRVQGNNSERRDSHPNQLPELYLARLIRAYTNPGDSVLDPFGGSGTTATVAVALGRDATTIELSSYYCQSILARIADKGAVRI